jgi:YidC/Oxa1 family membrane protein insertase
MSPEAMKLMMYGLPVLTLLFTWWLPAAVQLSFFVSGVLSFGQASLFKMPAFRSYFNMYPLPAAAAPTTSDGKPSTPYKGNMKVRAPLTQVELNNAFQESRKQSMLGKAKKSMMDATKEVRTAGGTMMGKTTESLERRRERSEKESRERYEKKRQEEIKAEIEQRKLERLEARASKKRARYEE